MVPEIKLGLQEYMRGLSFLHNASFSRELASLEAYNLIIPSTRKRKL